MENKEESFFPNFDPTNDLSQAGKQRRMKRGLGAKPLLESEIKDAQKKARSAMEAARLLGVSYNTYKKYARKYGTLPSVNLFSSNPQLLHFSNIYPLRSNLLFSFHTG